MFAYCENNPIMFVDLSGTEPYEFFDSADEAAIDFAMCYNAASIRDKQEYGSAIFMCSYEETRYSTHTLKIRIFKKVFTFTFYTPYEVLVTKYYYTKPSIGHNGANVIPNFAGLGVVVSTVHTHANYAPGYDNENFSKRQNWYEAFGDIDYANLFRMNIYVATPGGYLKKYTYKNRNNANKGVTIISSSIPWDPNSPDH